MITSIQSIVFRNTVKSRLSHSIIGDYCTEKILALSLLMQTQETAKTTFTETELSMYMYRKVVSVRRKYKGTFMYVSFYGSRHFIFSILQCYI